MIAANTARRRGLKDLNATVAGMVDPQARGVAIADSLPDIQKEVVVDGRAVPFNSPRPTGVNGFSPRFEGQFQPQPLPAPPSTMGSQHAPDWQRGSFEGPYQTPGIGDGIQEQRMGAELSVPRIDAAPQMPQGMMGRKRKSDFDWKRAIGTFAATMMASQGNPAGVQLLQMMAQRDRDGRQAEQDERERERKMFEPFTVGRQVIQRDETGGYKPLYSAPSAAEEYASALGHEPGSQGFVAAVEDYALKGWGGTAFGRKMNIQDDRQEGQVDLEGVRQDGRVDLEGVRYGYRDQLQDQRLEQSNTNNIRSTSTSRDNNIRSTSTSSANNQRSTAQSNTNNQRSTAQSNTNSERSAAGRKGGGSKYPDGTIIGNGKERRIRKNGQWVPVN